MCSNRRSIRLVAICLMIAAAISLSGPVQAERPNAPKLLPDTTTALVWIPDAAEMSQRYMNTGFGQMLQDPQLQPLVKHLYGSLADAVAQAQDRIGLSLSELLAIPQGEMAVALVAPEQQPPQVVVILDVGDQLSNARKLLERGTEALEKQGAKKSELNAGDTKLAVYEGVGPKKRTLIFFEKESTVVAGTSAEVLKQMIAVWNGEGEEDDTLAHDTKFASIMRRSGRQDQKPHLVWYVDPISLMRSIGQDNAGVQLAVAMLPALGLDGVEVAGGSFAFDAGQFDSVAYSHVLLEGPRSAILKMIAFEPGDCEPEPWVPADAAGYMTFNWNFQTTFDELVVLFDSFRGEGALSGLLGKGVKEAVGIDVEKELVPALAGRVTLCSRIQRPITLRSAATAVGFQLNDPEAFGEVLQRFVKKHEAVLERKNHAGNEYFQLAIPEFREERQGPPPPIPCFAIVGDYLILADHPGLCEQVIVTAQSGGESLADSLDFKLVISTLRRQSGGTDPAMISFERPQEGLRFYYDLGTADENRQRLRKQAENNPFLKRLNTALDENPLPPFAVIEQYFAPTGAMLISDDTGLHYMGFALRRKTE